jgi:hypothetical protein
VFQLVHASTLTAMIERLSNLSYLSNAPSMNANYGASDGHSGYLHHSTFNPRSVSFEVHTPEELAAVNEFLITLGRDVTTTTRPHASPSRNTSPNYEANAAHSFFNDAGLSELGLSSMPGIQTTAPGPASYPEVSAFAESGILSYPSRTHHQPVAVPALNFQSEGSMYPDVMNTSYPEYQRRVDQRMNTPASSFSDANYQPSRTFPTQSLNTNGTATSRHSALSTPSNSTHEFDYVKSSHRPPQIAQINTLNCPSKSFRTILPLKSVPGDQSPEPAESKIIMDTPIRRASSPGTPMLSPSVPSPSDTPASLDTSSSLYPLLTTSGDAEFKLPPLQLRHNRTPPPDSIIPAVRPRSATSSPEPMSETMRTVLPGIRSIAAAKYLAHQIKENLIEQEQDMASESGDDVRSVSEMDWEEDEDVSEIRRMKHAKLIRDLLVLINSEYKRIYGTPKMGGYTNLKSTTPVPESKSTIVMDIASQVSPATRMLVGPGVPGMQRRHLNLDIEMAAA